MISAESAASLLCVTTITHLFLSLANVFNILKTLAKERNKCVIVVTHSKEAADSADIILELSGKKLKKVK